MILGKKSFLILEKLDEKSCLPPIYLLEKPKPISYAELERRIDNLEDAGLVEKKSNGLDLIYITGLGRQVVSMIR